MLLCGGENCGNATSDMQIGMNFVMLCMNSFAWKISVEEDGTNLLLCTSIVVRKSHILYSVSANLSGN